jgi:hypothetical protein
VSRFGSIGGAAVCPHVKRQASISASNTGESQMMINTLAIWHQLVEGRNASGLDSLLSDEVVFHSPVVHTPQVGKAITTQYLAAAFRVFFNESFRYVREITNSRDAVLEFQVEIDGVSVNGVDMIKWDDEGKIVEFKVMIRPLKAINLIQQKMAAMLQSQQ